MNKKPVLTTQFYTSEDDHAFPRANTHVKESALKDVWDIVAVAALVGLLLCLAVLVMA
jgi:hypothetical protein